MTDSCKDEGRGRPGPRGQGPREELALGGKKGIVSPCLRCWRGAGGRDLAACQQAHCSPFPHKLHALLWSRLIHNFIWGRLFFGLQPLPQLAHFQHCHPDKKQDILPLSGTSFLSWPCWLPSLLTLRRAGLDPLTRTHNLVGQVGLASHLPAICWGQECRVPGRPWREAVWGRGFRH